MSTASKSTIKKLSRKKPVNIRLIESDIDRLKAIALSKGVPYQTFITELIHKYTSGKLIEK
ncbi:MAG: hypothetical protein H6767_00120 [Candidatus Peribacteria bacterium]|nr:MAG: hypothetical protein H6767_00120 [Candidatus Peribacteria bacterium]